MTGLRIAVALDGTGGDPAVFTAAYWIALAREADAAELDFITIEDSFGPPPGRARPDAVLVAARLAPVTRHIGLLPVATTTHTEPFHLSTALATLDYVSRGRAGWQVRVSADPAEAALLGRREPLGVEELFAEAADAVEVVRRLWDSWQDDAVIKDVATGRYIDRERLHYIDFTGEYFSVKGPSIVPRPPQGQPVVAALAHAARPYAFAARSADLVFVTPSGTDQVAGIVAGVREHGPLPIYADVVAAFGRDTFASDAAVFTGTPAELADLLGDWHSLGVEGLRLRPATLPGDLEVITRELVPLLRERGLFHPRPGPLRERLGLGAAVNRYAVSRKGDRVA
jgi:alkanesulfonate monooxygenase SsuD/methylene tetrahydromethanopterin reductase-like flavin-dependent oxidoreductase (luciferase family)